MPLQIAVTISVVAPGPTESDVAAATLAVNTWNSAHPESPQKPITPAGALRISYQEVQTELLQTAHTSYVQQYREQQLDARKQAWIAADDATRAQIDALLGIA